MTLPDRGLLEEFVAEIEAYEGLSVSVHGMGEAGITRTCEDRNVYIGGKEPGGSEFPEDREAVDEDKESSPEYTPHG